MGNSASIWLIIVLAVFAANLPFLNERCFAIISLHHFSFIKSIFSDASKNRVKTDFPAVDISASGLVFSSSDGSLEKSRDIEASADRAGAPLKSLWLRLFELIILYFCVGGIAAVLESAAGNRFPQGWEFYAINACLFLVLAFPGFVYRYLKRSHG
ncbi:uncharacterized protein DUF2818 [Undibacterium pigrum]|uniref:Uncharacterized protein DUF2818 n=1 Tax=Undibacterium pigrum TaxID=401470 RepID=A0A318JG95_9BURK|nr:uncharacterized protein DUF2818 [Undibacterium pigrum]